MLNKSSFEFRGIQIALLTLVTVLFYARSFDNYWIKDDLAISNFFEENEISWPLFLYELWPSHMESDHYWRPIPLVLGYFEHAFWTVNPAGYHLNNTLLHVLCAILTFFLANRLTRGQIPELGFFASLVVAISPINAEPVVWVMQRIVLFCAFFSLAAMLAWLKGIESKRKSWRVLALVFFALALLSKEIALTLPGLFFMLELFYSPRSKNLSKRFKSGIQWALPSAFILGLYFFCRWLMWGTLVNSYGGMDVMDYAAHNRVFELYGDTLFHGLVPVNVGVLSATSVVILRTMILTAYALLLGRALLLLWRNKDFRKLAALTVAGFFLWLVPIALICWIDERLFNARFFYQPQIATAIFLASAALLPLSPSGVLISPWPRRLFSYLPLLLLTSAFGVSLGAGLTAFDRGSQQIRGIQQAIVTKAEELREVGAISPVFVALYTPSQYQGVPTLEYSLTQALRPPLQHPAVSCVPLLDIHANRGDAWVKDLERILEREQWPNTNLEFVVCTTNPPGVRSFFGGREPAQGPYPATILGPADGRFFRNDAQEPEFRFRAPDKAVTFAIDFKVPGRQQDQVIAFGPKLRPGVNCQRQEEGVFMFRPSDRDPSQPELPDLWSKIVRRPLPGPIPLSWRVASYNSEGRLIGRSQESRFVIFNVLAED